MNLELRPVDGISRNETQALDAINALLSKGVDQFEDVIKQAAKKFAQLSPDTRTLLMNHPQKAQAQIAQALERVSLGELHPRLALASGWAARQLSRLGYEEQERAINDLIPVWLEAEDDHINKPFDELTRDEIAQVFDGTVSPPLLRSLPEQKAWLEAKKLSERKREREEKRTKLITIPGHYKIQGSVFMPEKPKFSIKELEKILAKMKSLQD